MSELNKKAAAVLSQFTVNACTDITGFGFLGHAKKMAEGSGVGMKIHIPSVPILPGSLEFAVKGIVPGGSLINHQWLHDYVFYDPSVSREEQLVLCDAVTSGGPLFSLPDTEAETCLAVLKEQGLDYARVIGTVTKEHPGQIRIGR